MLAGDSSGNTKSFNSQFCKMLLPFKLNKRQRSQLSHIHKGARKQQDTCQPKGSAENSATRLEILG